LRLALVVDYTALVGFERLLLLDGVSQTQLQELVEAWVMVVGVLLVDGEASWLSVAGQSAAESRMTVLLVLVVVASRLEQGDLSKWQFHHEDWLHSVPTEGCLTLLLDAARAEPSTLRIESLASAQIDPSARTLPTARSPFLRDA